MHVTMCLPQQSKKLLHTLHTWRDLWRRALEQLPRNHLKYLGIAKTIPDIEYLSRRIIEVAVSSDGASSRYLQRVPSYISREIHSFILDFATNI